MGSDMATPFDPADLPTGALMRLSPLVARVLAPNPSPFTYTGTQTYIVGAEDVAVIDPGPDDAAHLAALVDGIGGRPVRAILCTHTHRDHSPAAAPLGALTGAPVIGCAPLTMDDDGPRADAAFDAAYRPDRVLADGQGVGGMGWTLMAVATPGHTSNHLCFALPEEGGTTLASAEDWLSLVASAGLKGPVRELAAHSAFCGHAVRSEEHTSDPVTPCSYTDLVCRLLLE